MLSSVSEVQTDVSGDTLRALVRDEAQRLAEEARVATAETARADAAAVTDAHHRQISALQGRLRQQQRDLDLALAREGDLRRQIASLQADNVQVAALAQSMAAGSVGERDDGAGVGGASRGGGGDAAGAGTGEQAAAVLRTMKERYEESVRQLRAVFTVRVQGLVLCPRLRVDQARSSLTWPPHAHRVAEQGGVHEATHRAADCRGPQARAGVCVDGQFPDAASGAYFATTTKVVPHALTPPPCDTPSLSCHCSWLALTAQWPS